MTFPEAWALPLPDPDEPTGPVPPAGEVDAVTEYLRWLRLQNQALRKVAQSLDPPPDPAADATGLPA